MSRATDIISLEEFDRIAREHGLNPDLFVDPSWDSSNTLAFAEHVAELAAQRGYDEGRRVQNGDKLTADEIIAMVTSRATLTDAQIEAIRDCAVVDVDATEVTE